MFKLDSETKEALKMFGPFRLFYMRFLSARVQKLMHHFNLHHMKVSLVGGAGERGATLEHCHWCGLRRSTPYGDPNYKIPYNPVGPLQPGEVPLPPIEERVFVPEGNHYPPQP